MSHLNTKFWKNKKVYVTLGFLFMLSTMVYGQDQALADSLELIYNTGQFEEKDRLQLLESIAANHPNPDKSLHFFFARRIQLIRINQILRSNVPTIANNVYKTVIMYYFGLIMA